MFDIREVRNKKTEGLCKEEGQEKAEEKHGSQVLVLAEAPGSGGSEGGRISVSTSV